MKIKSIQLKNFFNHKDTSLNMEDLPSPILTIGRNGAGKSSAIVESLAYALFGETRLSYPDDAITTNTNEMAVSVNFELAGQDIEITRSKKRDKTAKLEMSVDGQRVEELLTETQKRINQMLNLSYDAFLSSIILRQDDSEFFLRAKPEQRKQIIGEILDLGRFEHYEKIAKEKRATLKADIKALQSFLDNLIDVDITKIEGDLRKVTKFLTKRRMEADEIQTNLDTLNAKNAVLETKRQQIQEQKSRVSALLLKVKSIEQEIKQSNNEMESLAKYIETHKDKDLKSIEDKIDGFKTDLEAANQEFESAAKALKNAQTSIKEAVKAEQDGYREHSAVLQNSIDKIKKEIAKLDLITQNECPTCYQKIDKDIINIIKKKFESELEENNKDLTNTKNNIMSLNLKLENINNYVFENSEPLIEAVTLAKNKIGILTKETEQYTEQYRSQMKDHETFVAAKTKLTIVKELIPAKTKELETIKLECKSLAETIEEEPTLIDIAEVATELSKAKKEVEQALQLQSEFQLTIDNAKKDKEKRAQLLSEITEKTQHLTLLEKLCLAFSHKGVPAIILQSVLPEIEEVTNYFLDKISDNLQIEFQTVEKLKSGSEQDTFKVIVYDGNSVRPFESFSGGEKFRISFALRLALSKILTNRAGVNLGVLILDEPSIYLDESGKDSFVSLIKSLSDVFPQIFIISHLNELKSQFDNVLVIKNEYN